MNIDVVVVGKTGRDYIAAGVADFMGRLGRYCQAREIVVKEAKGRMSAAERLAREGGAILDRIEPDARVVAMSPEGRALGSEDLAMMLGRMRDQGVRRLAFVIGGADGLAAEVRGRADMVLSLSKMTFTHEMARLILAEQLYRAFSILAGSKYHRSS